MNEQKEHQAITQAFDQRLRAGDCFGPRRPEQIHPSHELESIDDVGHCKVCLGAWIGGYVTLDLSSPCTKVKPKLAP